MSLHINNKNEAFNGIKPTNEFYFSSEDEPTNELHYTLKSFASSLNIIINQEALHLGIKLYDLKLAVEVQAKSKAPASLPLEKSLTQARVKLLLATNASLESVAFLFKYVKKKCPILASLGEETLILYDVEQVKYQVA